MLSIWTKRQVEGWLERQQRDTYRFILFNH
jgi:hypothetical protein